VACISKDPNLPIFCPDIGDSRLYRNHRLWHIDCPLWLTYGWGKAHRIARREQPKDLRSRVDFTFGETPWPAMRRILELVEPTPETRMLELGSGTGRFALFASKIFGLQAEGVDMVPTFIDRSNNIAQKQGLCCHFELNDLFNVPWHDASFVYVVATTFSGQSVRDLSAKSAELQPGARIVVVSHRLDGAWLEWETCEVLNFSWGPSGVFFHRKL